MISKRKNAITVQRALLCLTAMLLLVACMAGCRTTADPGDRREGTAESSFRRQMADAGVSEIAVKKDLVLEAPVEVKGTKILHGQGSITAVGDDWAGDAYMILVPADAKLTVKGSVAINAEGLAGGIHAAKGGAWSLEETASVSNASAKAANTLVEGVFQMNGGTLSGAMGHNVSNMGEVTLSNGEIIGSGEKYAGIYSEGTLTQDGGTVRDAYNNVSVMSGSFRFNGGNNQNSVRDGIYVAQGATLAVTAKSAVISGCGVRGIYLCGEGNIQGIALSNSGDSLVKVSQTGTLNLSGGTLTDAGYHSIENAGKMVMTGGTVSNSYNCGIVNTGQLEITGGSLMDNVNNKALLNKHNGKATVSGEAVMFSGNRFALANEDTATLELSGAGILLTTGTNVYAYDGTVNIHDISLGASGSNNVRIYDAVVTMTNVQVLGNSASGSSTTHGILLEGGVLNAKDVTIKNTTGYGIRNKGGHITAENLLISKSLKAGGINNAIQDHTGLPGVADIKNLTIEEIRYNNVVVDGGTMTVTNGQFKASGTNNTKITDGTLNLKNVDIYGNQPDVDGTNHAVYSTGGTLVVENVKIKDAKVTGLRVNGEKAVIRGSNVTISNTTKPGYGIDLSNGLINIDGLTMVNNYYNITTNGGKIQLSNSNLGATVSNNVRINKGGTVDLHNVVVKGHTPNHPKDVHALFVHEGKLTGEKVTVSNVATVGLRVKGGTAELHGLTVEDAGGDGVWIDNGKATVYDLVVKKAGAAGVSATNTADITVIGASIQNTEKHGAKSLDKAKVTLNGVSITMPLKNNYHGVLAEGGDVHLDDVKITGVPSNTEGDGLRINRESSHVTGKNVAVSNVEEGISSTAGTSDIYGVTMEGNQYNISIDGGNIQLLDSDLGATVSNNVRVNQGGVLDLQNVVVKGHVPDHPDNVHALFVDNGKLTGEKITVSNVATVGLRVKGGTAELHGLTVEDAGGDGVWIDNGKATVYDLVVKKAGAAGISATQTADITVIGGSINNTESHGAKSEGEAKLTLENITVSVSNTDDRHGVLAKGGDIQLSNVKITGLEKNTQGAGIRINENTSHVSGKGIHIADVRTGLSTSAGSAALSGVTMEGNQYNLAIDGGSIQLLDSDLGATVSNNVRVNPAGMLDLQNVVVKGHMPDHPDNVHGLFVDNGKLTGNQITVQNVANVGLRVKGGTADIQGLTVTDAGTDGVWIDGGEATVTDLVIKTAGRYGTWASGGSLTVQNMTLSDSSKIGIHVSAKGSAVLEGVNVSGSGTNNIKIIDEGKLTVNGYADGSKSQIGNCTEDNVRAENQSVITLNNVNVLPSAKNNVVAINGGTVYMTDSAVTGGNHSVLADTDGKVYLDTVSIGSSADSGIRANKEYSYVEGKNVTIDGANTGLSIKSGTVQISSIAIRNTKKVGVSVAQAEKVANVTLNNLVTENCGTNAIYTSGADAKLTVNGATLSNDGSDHVIYLNGGPMVLNDVTIHDANLASGSYELYSGAGWLTVGGAMDANIYIATDPGRVIKVNKALTGDKLVVDWANAPTGNALEFANAAMLDASKDHIQLGSVQSAINVLAYEEKTAKLEKLEIYTTVNSWSELTALVGAMTSGSYMDYRIAGDAADWQADTTLTIPAGVQVMLSPDKNAPAIEVASGVSPFAFTENTALTLKNLVVGGTASAKAAHIIVPKTAKLSLNNTTLQYFEGSRGGAVHVNCGTLNADGATFANNSNSTNWGGAIGIWGGTVNISNSLFTGNSSKNSGGAIINYMADGSSHGGTTDKTVGELTLTNCVFTKNTTQEHGGAIASWSNGKTTITGCVFGDENDAAMGNSVTKNGGAIHVQEGHKMIITDCGFFHNSTPTNANTFGGALYAKSSVKVQVSGCTFKNNSSKYGGAVNVEDNAGGGMSIDQCQFIDNKTKVSGGEGGALRLAVATTVTNCTFTGNVATGNGGAILVLQDSAKGNNVVVQGTTFTGNSGAEGGAISVATNCSVALQDVLCENNTTTKAFGSFTTWGYGDIRVADNTAKGAVSISGKIVATIWNNQAHAIEVAGALTQGSDVTIDWRLGKLSANKVGIKFGSEQIMQASKGFIKLGIDAGTKEGWKLQYSAASPWQATLVKE